MVKIVNWILPNVLTIFLLKKTTTTTTTTKKVFFFEHKLTKIFQKPSKNDSMISRNRYRIILFIGDPMILLEVTTNLV